MTTSSPFRNAVVVGGGGGIGSLLCQELASSGIDEVVAIDTCFGDGSQSTADSSIHQVGADVLALDQITVEFLSAADLVILAVPGRVATSCVPKLLRKLPSDALLVDTLSVKAEYLSVLDQQTGATEIVSINPMFAPDLGFSGRSVLFVDVTAGPKAKIFEALLNSWGSKIKKLSADQHDRYTGSLQAATHAAVLAFGMTLKKMGYDASELREFCPPPHHAMLSILARILQGEPETYFEIQRSNPYAGEARDHLRESIAELRQAAEVESAEQFATITTELARMLDSEIDDLAETCQRLFVSLSETGDDIDPGQS